MALVAVAISVGLVIVEAAGTQAGQAGPANGPVETPQVAVAPTTFGSLWCEDELEVIRAVEAGTLPERVLDEERYRTKLLIARGLLPRQAAGPCVS